ncbi:sigma-54-dependent Fis family transcriptional regulator [candidate division KSB1 bacterium]|nr:sigma-54-dependent Fis family transcriptional regulator [candidate division KSB1 bacterium]
MSDKKSLKIMVVDDEKILRVSLTDELVEAGYYTEAFDNAAEALEKLKKIKFDMLLTDIRMPEMDGIELLEKCKQLRPDIEVIMMTAYGSINSAVDAMKKGAYDYLNKPFQMDELYLLISRIEKLKKVQEENQQLRAQLETTKGDLFVGRSEAVQETMKLVEKVAKTDSTILITGETGTGKELLTQTIHKYSHRRDKPFIPVNCAVLSREIFESELFGYEKGAFTGANATRKGRFELADGGTLYLDDVDDIPLDLQVKLLRVLQERVFERVGGGNAIEVDVRVISSTKADLKQLIKEGKFREDLYYRLNVFPINLKPLRERKSDIPVLVDYFINQKVNRANIKISDNVLNSLMNYSWPGNVRELKNIVERLLLLAENGEIKMSSLPAEIYNLSPETEIGEGSFENMVRNYEISIIKQALNQTNGNAAKAAELLKLPATTLRSKISKLDIKI